MNMTLNEHWYLAAILALNTMVYTSSSFAATGRLVVESSDSAQNRQRAPVEKERQSDIRSLHRKINKRMEKEQDKIGVTLGVQGSCQKGASVNTY